MGDRGIRRSMIQEVARDFAEKKLRPAVMTFDETQDFPFALVEECAKQGFMGAMVDERYGGAGLSTLEFTELVEEISRIDPSMGLTICAHNGLCVSHLNAFASEEQKLKYLPDLCSGEKLGGWGLTEPTSGSDARAMLTSARQEGDSWIINGSKAFITHATVGSTFVVMAVTGMHSGQNEVSAFIVEKGTPGFSFGKKENKLGMRSSDTASLVFDHVRVPQQNMIGRRGEGFHQAMKTLEGGRIGIAALAVGLAQGALDASIRYAKERKQFGKPLSSFQAIQWKIADMATEIEAARQLTRRAGQMKMDGEDVLQAAAQAKLFASEVATRAANEAVQIHGGYGFTKDFPVEKFYRDVKLLTIGEGTSEVQRMVIAKKILG